MIDSRNISDLHPCLQRGFKELVNRMPEPGQYPVGVSSTYRDAESQNALYAQGRTKPGSIVTNAKGGQSIHQYRLAYDIFKNVSGHAYDDAAFFALAGDIWVQMGGVWGGNWTGFVDRPHFEYTGGLTLAQLQAGRTLPDDAKMPWEAEAAEKQEETDMTGVIYKTFNDLPAWAQPTIKKLIDNGWLFGVGKELDLSIDMVRVLVVNDRAGLYKGRDD